MYISLYTLFVCSICIHLQDSVISSSSSLTKRDNSDYFYDAALTDEEIQKQKEANKNSLLKTNEAVSEQKVEDPEWFKESNKPIEDPFAKIFNFLNPNSQAAKTSDSQNATDPQMQLMLNFFKEHSKELQAIQYEKFRQSRKSKSNLNHKLLSLLTLTAFFGISILVALVVAFLRGQQFSRMKNKVMANFDRNEKKKTIYDPVNQHIVDEIVVA